MWKYIQLFSSLLHNLNFIQNFEHKIENGDDFLLKLCTMYKNNWTTWWRWWVQLQLPGANQLILNQLQHPITQHKETKAQSTIDVVKSTLSGRIGKVVASHAEGWNVAHSNPVCGWAAPIYAMYEELRGYCPCGWGVRPVNWVYRLWRHCP